jgi:hypothetical protein
VLPQGNLKHYIGREAVEIAFSFCSLPLPTSLVKNVGRRLLEAEPSARVISKYFEIFSAALAINSANAF